MFRARACRAKIRVEDGGDGKWPVGSAIDLHSPSRVSKGTIIGKSCFGKASRTQVERSIKNDDKRGTLPSLRSMCDLN